MSTKFRESYSLKLNRTMSQVTVVLHDPEFFIINSNPVTIPRTEFRGESDETFYFKLYIEVDS